MNFWDTSALMALSVEEPRRQTALRVLEADEHIVVWWGSTIEYVAAISRRERDGSLTLEQITMLCSASLSSLRSAGFQPAWRPGWPPSQAGSPPPSPPWPLGASPCLSRRARAGTATTYRETL